MSARNSQRPESRASTTSATSHLDDSLLPSGHDAKPAEAAYIGHDSEAALLQQYNASMASQSIAQYPQGSQLQMGHHAQNMQYPVQPQYGAHESPYAQQDMAFGHHTRMPSVPIQPAIDPPEDKKRKATAVTATNDKELREMLAKNEGRPLRDVAHEVIQKERTPMAEKTKQLFAMLWYCGFLPSTFACD